MPGARGGQVIYSGEMQTRKMTGEDIAALVDSRCHFQPGERISALMIDTLDRGSMDREDVTIIERVEGDGMTNPYYKCRRDDGMRVEVFVMDDPRPADPPPAGKIRIVDDAGKRQRYDGVSQVWRDIP